MNKIPTLTTTTTSKSCTICVCDHMFGEYVVVFFLIYSNSLTLFLPLSLTHSFTFYPFLFGGVPFTLKCACIFSVYRKRTNRRKKTVAAALSLCSKRVLYRYFVIFIFIFSKKKKKEEELFYFRFTIYRLVYLFFIGCVCVRSR